MLRCLVLHPSFHTASVGTGRSLSAWLVTALDPKADVHIGGGRRSCRFTDRQPQTGQIKLALLRIAPVSGRRHEHGRDRPQSLDDLARLVEPPHLRVIHGWGQHPR